MTSKIVWVRQQQPASTGTQDFTVATGLTTFGAIFIWTNASVDGSVAAHCQIGVGITDLTNQYSAIMAAQDAVTTSNTWREMSLDGVILIYDPTDGSLIAEADIVGAITDGVQVTWPTVDGTRRLITCGLLVSDESDPQCSAIKIDPSTTVGNEVLSTINFEADDVLYLSCAKTLGGGSANTFGHWAFGLAHNGVSIVQRGVTLRYGDAEATTDIDATTFTNRVVGQQNADAALAYEIEHTTFNSTQIGITTRVGSPGGDDILAFPIKWGGSVNSELYDYSIPTSTGNNSKTGLSFKPVSVFGLLSNFPTWGATESDGDAGALAVVGFDDLSAEFSNSIAYEHNAAVTDAESVSDNQAVQLNDHDGSAHIDGTFVSMNSDGHTINFSAVDTGTARQAILLAVGGAGIAILRRRIDDG